MPFLRRALFVYISMLSIVVMFNVSSAAFSFSATSLPFFSKGSSNTKLCDNFFLMHSTQHKPQEDDHHPICPLKTDN